MAVNERTKKADVLSPMRQELSPASIARDKITRARAMKRFGGQVFGFHIPEEWMIFEVNFYFRDSHINAFLVWGQEYHALGQLSSKFGLQNQNSSSGFAHKRGPLSTSVSPPT